MSFAFDANVLLYASDVKSPFHVPAKEFVGSCASRGELFYLCWTTVMSYLRIATHPKIFQSPLTIEEALGNVEQLVGLRHCRLLSEDEGFWAAYRETVKDVPTRGNLVPDAHVVALLRHHGVRVLYTKDRDYRRFSGVEVRDPFAA